MFGKLTLIAFVASLDGSHLSNDMDLSIQPSSPKGAAFDRAVTAQPSEADALRQVSKEARAESNGKYFTVKNLRL
jgi:hypothetical protein